MRRVIRSVNRIHRRFSCRLSHIIVSVVVSLSISVSCGRDFFAPNTTWSASDNELNWFLSANGHFRQRRQSAAIIETWSAHGCKATTSGLSSYSPIQCVLRITFADYFALFFAHYFLSPITSLSPRSLINARGTECNCDKCYCNSVCPPVTLMNCFKTAKRIKLEWSLPLPSTTLHCVTTRFKTFSTLVLKPSFSQSLPP